MAVPAVRIASSRLPIASDDIKVGVGIVIVAAAICALVLVADQWWGVDHYQLVRDPNAIAKIRTISASSQISGSSCGLPEQLARFRPSLP
jgi:hypothetical protein